MADGNFVTVTFVVDGHKYRRSVPQNSQFVIGKGEDAKPYDAKNGLEIKCSKEQLLVFDALGNADRNKGFTTGDLRAFNKMSKEQQTKFINAALRGTDYRRGEVYDGEEDDYASVHSRDDMAAINLTPGGRKVGNLNEMDISTAQFFGVYLSNQEKK